MNEIWMDEQIERAMDALFPSGWENEDAEQLGSIIEGVADTLMRLAILNESDYDIALQVYREYDSHREQWYAEHDTMEGFGYHDFYHWANSRKSK